jgi:hypothetical protein
MGAVVVATLAVFVISALEFNEPAWWVTALAAVGGLVR